MRDWTPKYRVETRQNIAPDRFRIFTDWVVRERGRVSDANLERWVTGMNKSHLSGGVNQHVSDARGVIPCISHARIVNQFTGQIVATYQMAMFQVF